MIVKHACKTDSVVVWCHSTFELQMLGSYMLSKEKTYKMSLQAKYFTVFATNIQK